MILGPDGLPIAGSANASVARGMMRGVGARNAAMFGDGKPYDEEVNWIGSDGSGAWINSGVEGTGDLSVEFSCLVYNNDNKAVCGVISYAPSGYYRHHYTPVFSLSESDYWFNNASSVGLRCISYAIGKFVHYTIDCDNGLWTAAFDENTYSGTFVRASFSTGLNYGILGRPTFGYSSIQSKPSKFKMFKMRRGGVLLRDFIPVVKDNVAYLYDRCGSICPLTGTSLYANAGTGALTCG